MTRPLLPAQHGTASTYKRGCRCRDCTQANTAASRKYRHKRGVIDKRNVCQVGNQVFESQKAAARALNVSKSAICYHLTTYGNLDRLGRKSCGRNGGARRPVRVGVHEWPSRSALDRHLGKRIGTVSDWIKRGELDRLVAAVMQAENARAV